MGKNNYLSLSPEESCCPLFAFSLLWSWWCTYHSWQWEFAGWSFLGSHSIAIHLLLVMYTVLSLGIYSITFLHDRLHCTCKTQSRGVVMLQTRAGGLLRCPSPEGMSDWAGKWRIGIYCLLVPGLKTKKPMQALNKKHRRKDSYVDKCHLLTLQSDFFLLTGNLKKKSVSGYVTRSKFPKFKSYRYLSSIIVPILM